MYSPCWTKVLRGVAPVGLPAPPLLYLSPARAIIYCMPGDVLSSLKQFTTIQSSGLT